MTGKLIVTTPTDRQVVITRTFAAPRQLVFDASTKPELIRRWLLGPDGWTMPVCEVDLRVGGRYRYVWQNPKGGEMGMGGRFLAITPPSRIESREIFDEDWTGGETTVVQEFTEAAGVTTMTMTVTYASESARNAAMATGMTDGMEMGFARLDALLAGTL